MTFDSALHPRESAGTFAVKTQGQPEIALSGNRPSDTEFCFFPEPDGTNVQIIESPISDRDRNFWVTLADGAHVDIDVFRAGLADPGSFSTGEERLFIGREGDQITSQFVGHGSDFSEEADELSEDELSAIEEEVREQVKALAPGLGIEFSNGDRWDCVQGLYDIDTESAAQVEVDGRLSITTSNLLGGCETEPGYIAARDGAVQLLLTAALERRR